MTRPPRLSSVGARLAQLASTLGVCAGLAWLTLASLSPSLGTRGDVLTMSCATAVDSSVDRQLTSGDFNLNAPPSGNQGSSDDGIDDDRDDDSLAIDESVPLVAAATRQPHVVSPAGVWRASFVPSSQSLRAPPSIALF